jgi:hypothetical protein
VEFLNSDECGRFARGCSNSTLQSKKENQNFKVDLKKIDWIRQICIKRASTKSIKVQIQAPGSIHVDEVDYK